MPNNALQFRYGPMSAYTALGDTVDQYTLYYITDQNRVFRGAQEFTKSAVICPTGLPTTGEAIFGVMYVDTSNAQTGPRAFVFDGTAFVAITKTYATEINTTVAASDNYVPTTKAVADFVAAAIAAIPEPEPVDLDGFAHDITWSAANMTLTIPMVGATPDLTVQIPESMLLTDPAPYYDSTAREIVITFKVNAGTPQEETEEVRIPIAGIVKLQDFESTDSIEAVTTPGGPGENDTIAFNLLIDPADTNKAKITENGLYVEAPEPMVWLPIGS